MEGAVEIPRSTAALRSLSSVPPPPIKRFCVILNHSVYIPAGGPAARNKSRDPSYKQTMPKSSDHADSCFPPFFLRKRGRANARASFASTHFRDCVLLAILL